MKALIFFLILMLATVTGVVVYNVAKRKGANAPLVLSMCGFGMVLFLCNIIVKILYWIGWYPR